MNNKKKGASPLFAVNNIPLLLAEKVPAPFSLIKNGRDSSSVEFLR